MTERYKPDMHEPEHVAPDKLNEVMEFGHVIEVHRDGTVSEPWLLTFPGITGSILEADDEGQVSDEQERAWIEDTERDGWKLLTGYTGQYGYRGPIMHASEFIGGGLARDILGTPGLYVALVVDVIRNDEDEHEEEPAGWAVAFKEKE